jgi:hypothetical protein
LKKETLDGNKTTSYLIFDNLEEKLKRIESTYRGFFVFATKDNQQNCYYYNVDHFEGATP